MFINAMASFIITVLSVDDDDDDGILSVSDEISSFGFHYDDDDDVKRHQKINNAVMTIWPSPLMTPPLVLDPLAVIFLDNCLYITHPGFKATHRVSHLNIVLKEIGVSGQGELVSKCIRDWPSTIIVVRLFG